MKVVKFGLKNARALLPERGSSSNKSDAGRVLIIAGAEGFLGAAVLAARAAARGGAGYVTLMTDSKKLKAWKEPDLLVVSRGKPLSGLKFSAVGIGPGAGVSAGTGALLRKLARMGAREVVVDADALTWLAKNKLALPSTWILTPHEAEMARLLGIRAENVRSDRLAAVKAAQKKFGCHVLLKGHRSLLAAPGGKIYENRSGNPALAKAGTGDVLTGLITAFLAQGLKPAEAAALGAFVHGRTADDWRRGGRDVLALRATDLVERLPESLLKLRRGHFRKFP